MFLAFLLAGLGAGCMLPIRSFTPTADVLAADSAVDAAALRRAAWEDQVAFERFRIQNLPHFWAPSSGVRQDCTEAAGRFCLSPGDAHGAWTYIPEPPSIAAHRLQLVRALGDVGRRLPDDDWVVGQWVRYAVESELYAEALSAALMCAGSEWWCAALVGYTLHRAGHAEEAGRAFGMALTAMTPGERDRWVDPAHLLPAALGDSVRSLPEPERVRFVDRFWRLADPFFSRPGNEILSEHFARRVELQFQYAAGFLEGLPWGEDLDRIQLRYGTPWSRIGGMGTPHIDEEGRGWYLGPPFGVADFLSHYTMPGLDLLPPIEGLEPGSGEWDRITSSPRAGYNLNFGGESVRWLPSLQHQVARFRRDGGALIVAALDLAAHGVPPTVQAETAIGFIALDDPSPITLTARDDDGGTVGPLVARVAPASGLLSLEVVIPDEGVVGRVRRPLEIATEPGRLAMSDILLTTGDARPDSLTDALAVMRGSTRVQRGEAIGLFWEIYGIDPALHPEISLSLRLVTAEPGLLRRLGRLFGAVPGGDTGEIRWREPAVAGPHMARSVGLLVPDISDGVHLLELSMEVEGEAPVVTRVEMTVGDSTVPHLPVGAVTRRPLLRRPLCSPRPSELRVGNEANLQVSLEFLESQAFRDYWSLAWEFPPVIVPSTMSCSDWVRMNREYFGHGREFW